MCTFVYACHSACLIKVGSQACFSELPECNYKPVVIPHVPSKSAPIRALWQDLDPADWVWCWSCFFFFFLLNPNELQKKAACLSGSAVAFSFTLLRSNILKWPYLIFFGPSFCVTRSRLLDIPASGSYLVFWGWNKLLEKQGRNP